MFFVNWFYSVLNFLGLYNKKGTILFLGLDNAGKTTLLSKLKNEKLGQYEPTKHPNREKLKMGGVTFDAIDLGGHEVARKLWKEYFSDDVQGVVFICDAADKLRFEESKKELKALLKEDALRETPFLILGNKIDKKSSVSEGKLKEVLGLGNATTGKNNTDVKDIRPIEVFMCSILNEQGYGKGFRWIANFI